jgi:hypothetical protein
LKFTPRHSSYHCDYNKEKPIQKENITFLGKKQNEKMYLISQLTRSPSSLLDPLEGLSMLSMPI